MRTSGPDSRRDAQRERLRGMFALRRALPASAPVSDVRSRRLLRLFAEHARDETLPRDETSADPVLRARRRVGMVLRRRTLIRIALTTWGLGADCRCACGMARHRLPSYTRVCNPF